MTALRARMLAARDAGMSIVELIVTMTIFGIVIAATTALVIGVERTNAETVNRVDQIDSARTGAEHMARTLRTAVMPNQLASTCVGCVEDAFVRGEAYSVQFYANLDNRANAVGPSRVTYIVEPTGTGVGNLIQTVQKPDSPTPDPDTGYRYCDARPEANPTPACLARVTRIVIARDVLTATGTPLLRYFDATGAPLLPTGGALTAAQLARVLSVEVQLSTQDQRSIQPDPTTYIQRVYLPNAHAVIRQGEEEEN